MSNWWDDPDLQNAGSKVTKEDVKAQQSADATPAGDTWGHFMDVISNSLGRGVATALPYIADIASLNRVLPHNPTPELTGQGRFTEKASRAYSKLAGDEIPQNKAEEYGSAAAMGLGAAAVPLGSTAGMGRALVSGVTGGLAAQGAHDIFPDSELAPVIAGVVGGFGPHAIEGGVRSAVSSRNIRAGASHPMYDDIVDTIVGLEGGGTLTHPKTSPKGAMGVMQVMPDTARDPGFGIRPWNGRTQADLARVGRQYAAALTNKYGGEGDKILAAYNAGPGKVDSLLKKYGKDWFRHLPAETQKYVNDGFRQFRFNRTIKNNPELLASNDGRVSLDRNVVDENEYFDWPSTDPDHLAPGEKFWDIDGEQIAATSEREAREIKAMLDRSSDDYIPELDDPVTPEERAADDAETHVLNSDDHLDLNDDFFMDRMGQKFDLDRNYTPTTAEQERLTEIQQERPDFYWGNFGYRKGDELSNVTPFPGERIVNPDKAGPLKPEDMSEEQLFEGDWSNVESFKAAKDRQYQKYHEENNRKLKEQDDAYLDHISQAAENAKFIIDEHLAGRPVLSSGEMAGLFREWSDLHERMKKSTLPPLGKDIVDDVMKHLEDFMEKNKDLDDPKDIILDPESSPVVRKQEVAPLDVRATPEAKKAANEHNRTIVQLLKDLWNDESGSLGKRPKIIGNIPNEGLSPAIISKDGTIYTGPRGGGHYDIVGKYSDVEWKDDGGFIDQFGQYLTRREAARRVAHPQGSLDAIDYLVNEAERDPRIKAADEKRKELFLRLEKGEPVFDEYDNARREYNRAVQDFADNLKKNKGNIFKRILEDDSGSGVNPFDRGDAEGRDGSDYTPVDKLRQALRDAQPIRDVQESMYSRARSKRFSEASDVGKRTKGEEGLYAEMGALKGALPKANYESIRGQFSQEDLDGLFDHIKNSPRLSYGESIRARVAFAKMIGDRDANYATVPTDSEIQLLGKVFPKELIAEILRKKPLKDRVIHNIVSGLNIPRSLMASLDLSAPFRQGVFLVGRKEFWTSFDDMFKAFGSEKAFQAIQDDISSRPTYRLMKKGRLALSGADHVLSQREEAFMSDLAEKLPGERVPVVGLAVKGYNKTAGNLVRRSTRAYEGFLNKLRADTFDRMVKLSKDAGIDIEHDQRALKDITRFINAATGRGDLGKLNQAAPILSAAFFSPRLAAARIQMLTDPRIYMASNPVVRKEAIKSLMSFVAIQVAAIGLLSYATGGSVNLDPRSTDFAKIKIGNTRIDTLGGFQQYIRLAAVLATGKEVGSNGKVRKLNDDKVYKGDTYASVLGRFARGKESPVASFIHDNAAGKDIVGKKVAYPQAIYDRFTPLVIQDIRDVAKTQGYPAAAALGTLAVFGVGLQTYETKPETSKGSKSKNWWDDPSLSTKTSKKKEWWEQ